MADFTPLKLLLNSSFPLKLLSSKEQYRLIDAPCPRCEECGRPVLSSLDWCLLLLTQSRRQEICSSCSRCRLMPVRGNYCYYCDCTGLSQKNRNDLTLHKKRTVLILLKYFLIYWNPRLKHFILIRVHSIIFNVSKLCRHLIDLDPHSVQHVSSYQWYCLIHPNL